MRLTQPFNGGSAPGSCFQTSFTSFLIATCIFYLNGAVLGMNWKNTVPKTTQSLTAASGSPPEPQTSWAYHLSSSRSNWYSPQLTKGPSTGLFHSDLLNSSSSRSSSLPPLVPRPRSLSEEPLDVKSKRSANKASSSISPNQSQKKGQQKPKNDKKSSVSVKSTNKNAGGIVQKESSWGGVGPSARTFIMSSVAPYLLPVFFAQMVGMGMLPAAGLLLLPLFLLPVALTMAVFLI